MENSQTRLHFLDTMINKSGAKIWIDICNKPTDSKLYLLFTLNNPWHSLTNTPFSLAREFVPLLEKKM